MPVMNCLIHKVGSKMFFLSKLENAHHGMDDGWNVQKKFEICRFDEQRKHEVCVSVKSYTGKN